MPGFVMGDFGDCSPACCEILEDMRTRAILVGYSEVRLEAVSLAQLGYSFRSRRRYSEDDQVQKNVRQFASYNILTTNSREIHED